MPKRIIPPSRGPASITVTACPDRRNWYAADMPEGPAPTTSTCLPVSSFGGVRRQPFFSASSPRKRSTELMPTAVSILPRLQTPSHEW